MKQLKVMTIVGTRPEIIRLSRIINKLDMFSEHVLVHTGQNYDYELNKIFFEDLEIRDPDFYLDASGKTAVETISNVISKADKLIEQEKPDCVLVLGDTNSCLSLLAAKRRKIPTFHMEAGNRCFDMRVPEEINRKIVDHIADINITYSSIAREYLLREGLQPDTIIKVGSPMAEVLTHFSEKINCSQVLSEQNLELKKFFLVSAHREENIDNENNFNKLTRLLNSLCKTFRQPVIVSTHPRTRAKINFENVEFHELVRLVKPLSFSDYNKLQISARAVLSDSGTISEESSILNFPALNIREAHERPEAMEQGAVMMTGLNAERVFQSIKILDAQSTEEKRVINLVDDYSSTNISDKVVRIIHSYTDYVKSNIWKIY